MALIGKSHCNAIPVVSPELFNEPIVQFPTPFALEERNDLLPSIDKLSAVSPARIYRVSQRHFFRIARVPAVFGHTNFLNGRFASKWGQRRTCRPVAANKRIEKVGFLKRHDDLLTSLTRATASKPSWEAGRADLTHW